HRALRLTEGATVREFAEALGITPRDIVQLLIKRGIFATLNQPIGEKMAIEMASDYGVDLSFVPFDEMVIVQEFEELIAADADNVTRTVAADEILTPQTSDSTEHPEAASRPMIAAINKIHRPDPKPDKVKQGLAARGLQPTHCGRETEMVPHSARTRDDMSTL